MAREVEFGFDLAGSSFSLSPRLFYSRVDDYIQGTPSEVAPAVMFVRMMNMMDGGDRPDPLQFNNVEASFYGFDMDWSWQLSQHWSLSGIVNYVRGKREDISDDLYRIAPPNTTIRLSYATATWSASVENVLYSSCLLYTSDAADDN